MCRARALRPGERVAGAGIVPAPGPDRQRPRLLCRPSQPRHAAAPAAADEGGGPDHRARHAPRRHQHDDVLAPAAAATGRPARARARRSGRVEPRLPGRSGHRCLALSGGGPARGTGADQCSTLDRLDRIGPARVPEVHSGTAERAAPRRRPGRRHPASGDTSSRERDPLERCGELHRLGAPVLYVPAAADRTGADERRDGLRLPCFDCCKPAASRPGDRLCRRGRRFPDVCAGARNCSAIRRAGHRAHRQQRHVRNDPHAPGSTLSRACLGHRFGRAGFRGAGQVFWRPCRARRDHRRLCVGI